MEQMPEFKSMEEYADWNMNHCGICGEHLAVAEEGICEKCRNGGTTMETDVSTERIVAHTVTQHNDAPDSIELTRNTKGYTWNVKIYGDSSKDREALVNRAFLIEADIRAKVKILESTPSPVKSNEQQIENQ